VPVFTFLLLPFALGKTIETSVVTVAFGLGANAAFIVLAALVGLGMENVDERFNEARRPLETLSAAALLAFGMFYMAWALGPTLFGWGNPSHQLPTIYEFIDFIRYLMGR